MRETYKATGMANRSTTISYEGSSKREVIQAIRQITEANRYEGKASHWVVCRKSDGAAVAAGGVDSDGRRYRLGPDWLKNLTGY